MRQTFKKLITLYINSGPLYFFGICISLVLRLYALVSGYVMSTLHRIALTPPPKPYIDRFQSRSLQLCKLLGMKKAFTNKNVRNYSPNIC